MWRRVESGVGGKQSAWKEVRRGVGLLNEFVCYEEEDEEIGERRGEGR